jgi:hypothetical protein
MIMKRNLVLAILITMACDNAPAMAAQPNAVSAGEQKNAAAVTAKAQKTEASNPFFDWLFGKDSQQAPSKKLVKAGPPPQPKTVSVLLTAHPIVAGQTITANDVVLKSVPVGQKPTDAVGTKTLTAGPNGLACWQARYTLPEATVLSFHALGPGRWVTSNGQWSYVAERAGGIAHRVSRKRGVAL